jgi:hypothetical protein
VPAAGAVLPAPRRSAVPGRARAAGDACARRAPPTAARDAPSTVRGALVRSSSPVSDTRRAAVDRPGPASWQFRTSPSVGHLAVAVQDESKCRTLGRGCSRRVQVSDTWTWLLGLVVCGLASYRASQPPSTGMTAPFM